jgi:hypothetical protein
MTQPAWPLFPVQSVPPPEMSIRSRRDLDTRDAANARNFEHWQTDGKYMTYNRPDMNAQAPFFEFLPINSRFDGRNYMSQPRYDADGSKLGKNTYFDKYDPSFDNRNAIRELQAVVYEDKIVDGTKENNEMLTRQLENRWMTPEQQQLQIEMSTQLRPNRDDYTKLFRDIA